MMINPRFKSVEKSLIASGALATVLFAGGCAVDNSDREATDKFAVDNRISADCLTNVRARVSVTPYNASGLTVKQLEAISTTACPGNDNDAMYRLTTYAGQESIPQQQKDDYVLPIAAIVVTFIGLAVYAAARPSQP